MHVDLSTQQLLNIILTVCNVPSLHLDCSNRKNVRVTWKEDCVINCDVTWSCTNGEDVSVVKVSTIFDSVECVNACTILICDSKLAESICSQLQLVQT